VWACDDTLLRAFPNVLWSIYIIAKKAFTAKVALILGAFQIFAL
jgi:hypothetical protein